MSTKLTVRSLPAKVQDPLGPVSIIVNDGQGLPLRLHWQPDQEFEHLSTVWALMLVLIRGQYVPDLRFTSWSKASASGKTMAKGTCSLLEMSDPGPTLVPGEILTFNTVSRSSPAEMLD